jgi:HD-like signal output (HDOD) protein/ActR/RegA family two-component response regulator
MKKRILFVEDNPILLQAYAMMLGCDDIWDVSTAADAQKALVRMEEGPFDVIVSDMNMPGMSGADLIKEVRIKYPRTSRIIISGISDQQEVANCLGTTHQFLAKPFNAQVLKATLARLGGLDSYLHDEKLRALVGRVGSLPSFPSIYLRIMEELDKDDPSVESISAIIGKDPGMTAKMLQIVNSVAFGLTRQVVEPFEAVQQIGLGSVRSLVLSAHIFSCFEPKQIEGFSMEGLWSHSMRAGRITRLIMQLQDAEPADVEEAAIAGMMHDIGRLMLANSLPDQFQKAARLAVEKKVTLHEAEMQVFGATHAGAAAYLLGLWGLPAAIVEAVAFHHTPGKSDLRVFSPLTAVHAADVLEHELSESHPPGSPELLDMDYLRSIGMQDNVETWRTEALEMLQADEE